MNIYAFSSLAASYIFFILGVFIYQKDSKNELNRIYLAACVLLGYLALVECGLREAPDAAAVYTWFKIGALWPFAIVIYVHFSLVFTKKVKILKKKITYVLLYAPACIFSIIELTSTSITGEPRKEYWGWTYSVPEDSFVYTLNALWFFSLAILPVLLCFLYFRSAPNNIEKRRATYVLVGLTISAVVGLITEGIFPEANIKIPELTIVTSVFEVGFIAYGIHKYNIFALTPAGAAEHIAATMSNILFLARTDGTITQVNRAARHLLGCTESELIGQPLKRVFTEKEWESIEKSFNNLEYTSRETHIVTKERVIPVLMSISVIKDKEQNIQGILCIGTDLTDHKKAEESRRKEVLLKEIHHRVKDNMQIISSLLNLQSTYFNDEQDKEMIKKSQTRIKSMALVHEKLYQSKDVERLNAKEYITEVVSGLVQAYSVSSIAVKTEVEPIFLKIDTAIPCGLIINELVSNSLNHAFPDKKGEITVTLHAVDDTISLTVGDNGVGIPDTIDFRTAQTLGLRLVTILAEDQLNGTINVSRNKGTEFCIIFNL
jgi:PAS domain S-box-containing protein